MTSHDADLPAEIADAPTSSARLSARKVALYSGAGIALAWAALAQPGTAHAQQAQGGGSGSAKPASSTKKAPAKTTGKALPPPQSREELGLAVGVGAGGIERTDIHRITREELVADVKTASLVRAGQRGEFGNATAAKQRLARFDAEQAQERRDIGQRIADRRRDTDDTLLQSYADRHPGQQPPSVTRLRVDAFARTQGIDTNSPAYRGGQWREQAAKAGADRATLQKLDAEDTLLNGR